LSPLLNLEAGGLPLVGSASVYSIYTQLPSISGDRSFHTQPEDDSCRGDSDPLDMDFFILNGLNSSHHL